MIHSGSKNVAYFKSDLKYSSSHFYQGRIEISGYKKRNPYLVDLCPEIRVATASVRARVRAFSRACRWTRARNRPHWDGGWRRLSVQSGRDQLGGIPRRRRGLQFRVPQLLRQCFAVHAVVVVQVVVVLAHGCQLVLDVADIESPASFDVNAGINKFQIRSSVV